MSTGHPLEQAISGPARCGPCVCVSVPFTSELGQDGVDLLSVGVRGPVSVTDRRECRDGVVVRVDVRVLPLPTQQQQEQSESLIYTDTVRASKLDSICRCIARTRQGGQKAMSRTEAVPTDAYSTCWLFGALVLDPAGLDSGFQGFIKRGLCRAGGPRRAPQSRSPRRR